MAVLTVDLALRHDRELCAILTSDKLYDFLIGAWLLASKLVAREGNYLQTSRCKFLMHLNQLRVVLGGQCSFGSDIYDEVNLFIW